MLIPILLWAAGMSCLSVAFLVPSDQMLLGVFALFLNLAAVVVAFIIVITE